jgi:hypothetical protein
LPAAPRRRGTTRSARRVAEPDVDRRVGLGQLDQAFAGELQQRQECTWARSVSKKVTRSLNEEDTGYRLVRTGLMARTSTSTATFAEADATCRQPNARFEPHGEVRGVWRDTLREKRCVPAPRIRR